MGSQDKTRAQLLEELSVMKQRVDELEERTIFHTNLLNAVGQAIIATTLQGEIVFFNRFAEQLYGWSAEEALGRNIMDVTVPQISQGQAGEIMAELGRGISWSGEFSVKHRDGTVFPALVVNTPILDPDGEFVGIIGASSDISARKQIEEQLQQSEVKFRNVVEQSVDGIAVTDTQGLITVWNRGIEQITGLTALEMLGKPIWDVQFQMDTEAIKTPERQQQLKAEFQKFLRTGKAPNAGKLLESELVRPDGTRVAIEGVVFPIEIGAGFMLASITRDTTERKRMEQEFIRLQRLRAMGELSAGVSHNLNNILTGVLLPAQMLRGKIRDPAATDLLNDIIASGKRASDLVHRLRLSVRGIEEGVLEEVSLNQLVHEAIRNTRPRWKDEMEAHSFSIDIITHLDEVPPIKGTQTRLYDILINLIFNAVDAMPKGGRITIQTAQLGEAVQLSFSDTGMGMDAETVLHIFEPFFTTKMEKGTGLGLATVYNTIVQWGGEIDVVSAPGKGTTFKLLLPLWNQSSATRAEVSMERATRSGKLLVVEDDDIVRNVLGRLFSPPHEVRTYAMARAALRDFAAGTYDVIVTDLGMDDLAGDLLARQMLAIDPSIATVLISGWELPVDDPRRQPFDFFIQKPFDGLDQVKHAIACAIELHDARIAGAG